MSQDIDSFIKQQKAKLAAERDDLDTESSPRENGVASDRKQWDKSNNKQNQGTPRMRPETPEHTGLPIGGYEEKRRKLQQERQKEYNEMISKAGTNSRSRYENYGNSLRFDSRSQLRKQLENERNDEYNQLLKTPKNEKPKTMISPEHTSIRLDSGSQRRRQLEEDRNKEYNELIEEKQSQKSGAKSPEHIGLPLGKYEQVKKTLEEERIQDYKEHSKKTPDKKKASMFPEISPENTSLRFDSGSQRRRELSEERNKEYNKLQDLKQLSPRSQKDPPENTGLPISDSGYQRYRAGLQKEKQEDFNMTKEAKGVKNTTESLPHVGLPITGSHQQRQQDSAKTEMNKEYNEFLARGGQPPHVDSCPSPPHLGLDVGSYGETRKRLEKSYQEDYKEFLKKKEEDKGKPKVASLEHVGLPLGSHEQTRAQLEEERNKEYNEHLEKGSQKVKKPGSNTAQHLSLPVTDSSYMNYRAKIKDTKNKEYNEYLQKPNSMAVKRSPEHEGLPLTNSSHHRQKASMKEMRNREYNEFLLKKGLTPEKFLTPPRPPTPQHIGLPLGSSEEKKKQLDEERRNEYNQFLSQKSQRSAARPYQPPSEHKGLPLGDETRKRGLEEERRMEYNDFVRKKQPQTRREKTEPQMLNERKENIPPRAETPEVPLGAKLGVYEGHRRKLQEERSKEYNRLKSDGRAKFRDDFDRREQDEDFEASLPGVRDHPSAQRRSRSRGPSRLARDEEEEALFRQWLREREPRRGWATPTPTYEEILDKKRQEERSYRRNDEPEMYTPRGVLGGPNYMRSSISDGNINRIEDDMKRFNDLDREYERKRDTFKQQRTSRHDPEVEFSQWKSRGLDDYDFVDRILRKPESKPKSGDSTKRDYAPRVRFDDDNLPRNRGYDRGPPLSQDRDNSFSAPTRRHERSESGPNSIVPTARDTGPTTEAQRKAMYAAELRRQMDEDKKTRQREREEDMRGNPISGGSEPPQRPSIRVANPAPAVPQQYSAAPGVAPPPRPYDDYSSQTPNRPPVNHQPGILDRGFGAALYGSPLEDAYRYYADRDPLNTASQPPPTQPPVSNPVRVQAQPPPFVADTGLNSDRSRTRSGGGLPFPTGDSQDKNNLRAKSQNYQEELRRQIEEQKRKKEEEKAAREAYEKKKDEEIRNYDPFGKGGGGAPMRDRQGNIIANLRQMHLDNEQGVPTTSRVGDPPPAIAQVSSLTPRKDDDSKTFARGGNGIFGEAKSDAQKTAQQRYQDELRQQMEERKRQQEEEKRKKREEDAREQKRLEEDNKKIQQELEAEKRKEEEKAKEAQRQQEELRQRQEEKRQEELRKQREADEKERREREEQRKRELDREQEQRRRQEESRERPRSKRGGSPPVPAVRTKIQSEGPPQSPPIPTLMNKPPSSPAPNDETHRTSSPAVPALRSKTEPNPGPRSGSALSRKDSASVLNQLARMRAQLQNENHRVEKDLEREKKEPTVYDPRLDNPKGGNVDVFELNRPRAHRRSSADRTSQSRHIVKQSVPRNITNNHSLEAQQSALIAAQEDMLRSIRPGSGPGVSRAGSVMSAAMLDSESAFIAVGNSQSDMFPPSRNGSRLSRASPRERCREQIESPQLQQNPMGSVISLDPDRLNSKNEARLKKLKSIAGDEISTGDPDDILERFMSKQKHSRPPSGI